MPNPGDLGIVGVVILAIILVLREALPYISKKRALSLPPPPRKSHSSSHDLSPISSFPPDFPWAALADMAKRQQDRQPVTQAELDEMGMRIEHQLEHFSDSIAGLHKEVHSMKTMQVNDSTALAEHIRHDDERFREIERKLSS